MLYAVVAAWNLSSTVSDFQEKFVVFFCSSLYLGALTGGIAVVVLLFGYLGVSSPATTSPQADPDFKGALSSPSPWQPDLEVRTTSLYKENGFFGRIVRTSGSAFAVTTRGDDARIREAGTRKKEPTKRTRKKKEKKREKLAGGSGSRKKPACISASLLFRFFFVCFCFLALHHFREGIRCERARYCDRLWTAQRFRRDAVLVMLKFVLEG